MKTEPQTAADPLTTRTRIVKAALTLIGSEGFGAVTAPRLAEEIGLRRPIIYYYFQDIDDVALEAVRLSYQESKAAFLGQGSDREPSQVMWDMLANAAAPMAEFTALALRKEKFKALYQDIILDLRSTFSDIFGHQEQPSLSPKLLDAEGYALLIQITSIALATEKRLGMSLGHNSLKRLIRMLRS